MKPRRAEAERLTDRARLLRIADRLGKVSAGSAEADQAIHQALGRAGPAPPYTSGFFRHAGYRRPEWSAACFGAGAAGRCA